MLDANIDDPSLRRLFPTAYPDDAERDREYRQLVGDELVERRRAAPSSTKNRSAPVHRSSTWLTAEPHCSDSFTRASMVATSSCSTAWGNCAGAETRAPPNLARMRSASVRRCHIMLSKSVAARCS